MMLNLMTIFQRMAVTNEVLAKKLNFTHFLQVQSSIIVIVIVIVIVIIIIYFVY